MTQLCDLMGDKVIAGDGLVALIALNIFPFLRTLVK